MEWRGGGTRGVECVKWQWEVAVAVGIGSGKRQWQWELGCIRDCARRLPEVGAITCEKGI